MEEATEGIQDLASSVSSPLMSFVDSLNASTAEVELLLSRTDEWLGELEGGMLLRLNAFDTAHRQAAGRFASNSVLRSMHASERKRALLLRREIACLVLDDSLIKARTNAPPKSLNVVGPSPLNIPAQEKANKYE